MSLGQRVLAKAIEKLGLERVAVHLGIRPTLLASYVDGQRPVPDAMLLKMVDLVFDDPQVKKP